MYDPVGFLRIRSRKTPCKRPISERLKDWKEIEKQNNSQILKKQASRCMNCGVPFCHKGCPLGNFIPEWNTMVYNENIKNAVDELHSTNNFPEFTGRICPAPCESSCVLGINQPAVTIKQIEVFIADEAFRNKLITPQIPKLLTGYKIAIVGSGPAGLAAAQQLTRLGHQTDVYEKDDKIGGLLRYGIPDFKLEKHHIDRRIQQMKIEGTRFITNMYVGKDVLWTYLKIKYDALIIAIGCSIPRDIKNEYNKPIDGRNGNGIHYAMKYLKQANMKVNGIKDIKNEINANNKHVVILGGGDTGVDCLGTANRQKATSVNILTIGKKPPTSRTSNQMWPIHPNLFEISSSHEEGCRRKYLALTKKFILNKQGSVIGIEFAKTSIDDIYKKRLPKFGTDKLIKADLVFLALGYSNPDPIHMSDQLGIKFDKKGHIIRNNYYESTKKGIFVAGDAGRGQSLIVWAIAEGRAVASSVNNFLTNKKKYFSQVIKPKEKSFKDILSQN